MEFIPRAIQLMETIARELKMWYQDAPGDEDYPSGTVDLRNRNGVSLSIELLYLDELLTLLRVNDQKEIARSLEQDRDRFLPDLQAVKQAIEIGEGPPFCLTELQMKITHLIGTLEYTAKYFRDKLTPEKPGGTAPDESEADSAAGTPMAKKTKEASDRQKQKSKTMREPLKEAVQAYNLYYGTGKTQQEVAEIMTKKLKKPVSQGQVSKWLTRYKKWRKVEGNPVDDTKPNIITNSNIIDMGARTDGRITGDPLHKKNANYEH